MKRIYFILSLIFFSMSFLQACHDPNEDILEQVMVVTQENISQLDQYPNLEKADLRGSDCYDVILSYIDTHPGISVEYDVSIGGQRHDSKINTLTISPENLSMDELLTNLKYLPNVTSIELPETTCSANDIDSIQSAHPRISLTYTVNVNGSIYNPEDTSIDLSVFENTDLALLESKLALLPCLTEAELMRDDGTSGFSPADVKQLQDSFPNIFFRYTFDLFGKPVSTSDEQIEYDEVSIGNEGEAAIREALDILSNCTYIKFDDCGIDSSVMAGIRDDYPSVKVVWRIHVDKFSMLTDETMIRMTHRLVDTNINELQYATEVTYMDIGHNPKLTDISFVAHMPKLECVIISGSSVTDISYFANCPNLTWLECCFCGPLEDISPVASLKNLKYLNISFTKVKDISALKGIPLERLNSMHTKVPNNQKNEFIEDHPECISVFKGRQPYGYGWRYNDHGYTFFDYYLNMREVFRYDDKEYNGNRKES